jgi:hypothetical protein
MSGVIFQSPRDVRTRSATWVERRVLAQVSVTSARSPRSRAPKPAQLGLQRHELTRRAPLRAAAEAVLHLGGDLGDVRLVVALARRL